MRAMAHAQLADYKMKLASHDALYIKKARTQHQAHEPLVRAYMDDNQTAVQGPFYLFYVQTAYLWFETGGLIMKRHKCANFTPAPPYAGPTFVAFGGSSWTRAAEQALRQWPEVLIFAAGAEVFTRAQLQDLTHGAGFLILRKLVLTPCKCGSKLGLLLILLIMPPCIY